MPRNSVSSASGSSAVAPDTMCRASDQGRWVKFVVGVVTAVRPIGLAHARTRGGGEWLWLDRDLRNFRRGQRFAHAAVISHRGRRAGERIDGVHARGDPGEDDVARRQRVVVVKNEELAAV